MRVGLTLNQDFRPRTTDHGPRPVPAGFTLLELMIVITLILILAAMAAPTYHVAIVRAREATPFPQCARAIQYPMLSRAPFPASPWA